MRSRCLVAIAMASACGRFAFDPHADGGGDAATDAPAGSCTNAVRDGSERGIDCGGSCTAACPGDACSLPGDCITGICRGNVCELASGPPFWQPGPALQVARTVAAAALGGDGALYVIGGADATTALGSVEVLAPGTTSFAFGPPLVTARAGHAAAALLDGSIYAFGGRSGPVSSPTYLMSLEHLAVTWQPRASTTTTHASIAAAGGSDGNFYVADSDGLWRYTPSADSWTNLFVTTARDEIGFARGSDDRLYEVGGHTSSIVALATVEAWSAATGWVSRAPTSVARAEPTVVAAPDGRIYTVGGTDLTQNTVTSVEAYLPASNRWTMVPPLATRRRGAAGALGPDGRLYVAGGESFGGMPLGSVEAYGPTVALAPTGSTLTISGANFAASALVGVVIDGAPAAAAMTDTTGAFAITLAQVDSGSHIVVATDVRSQFPAVGRVTLP